jgi:hypothetical protein
MCQINQTLTQASLTEIRNAVTGNQFLLDESSTTDALDGQFRDDDVDRACDYSAFAHISIVCNNLKGAMFSVVPAEQSACLNSINTSMSALLPTGSCPFHEDELFTKFTTYSNSNWSNKNRALYLCFLTVKASTAFDALYYYYNSTTDPDAQTKLDTLRRIVQACYDMLVFVDDSYGQMIIDFPSINSYKWGMPYNHTTGHEHDFTTTWHGNTYDIDLPNYYFIQDRLMMLTARGYAALMLRKDAEVNPGGYYTDPTTFISQRNADINNIKTTLTQTPFPNVGNCTNKTGLLDFHTGNSGRYIESLGYLNWVMVWSNPFFASLARLAITDTAYYNYYNDPSIIKWVNDVTDKTTPYLNEWAYNDTHYLGYESQKHAPNDYINTFQSCAIYFYYYNTTNPQDEKQDYIRDKCAWYIQSRKLNHYPGMLEFGNSYIFLLLYYNNPLRQLPNSTPIPQNYAQGTWSNKEFGILRKQINVRDDLVNNPAMYITFKNSMNCWHNHADQTAFSFFYRGKQFLIDPGYNNIYAGSSEFTHTWTQSPYAHNMIVVNPLDEIYPATHPERTELDNDYHNWLGSIIANQPYTYNQVMFGFGNYPTSTYPGKYSYRPTCIYETSSSTSDEQLFKSKSYQTYYSKENDKDIIQVHLEYDYRDNNVSQNNPFYVNLTRSYIRDGDLFFVYDDMQSHLNSTPETPVSKTYWNLLQTGVWTNNTNSLTGSNGLYSIIKGEDPNTDCVDLASGSTLPATYYVDDSSSQYVLPMDNLLKERIGNNQSYGQLVNNKHIGVTYDRIRVTTTGIDPKFLTVIAPRETYTGAQSIIQTITTPNVQYGNAIASKSHTNATTLCTTYCGVSNGTNISAAYTTNTVQTNGKFYLVTRPNSVSSTSSTIDNSLVLMNGSYIDVSNTHIYHCYSPDVNSMSASYLNQTLHVDLDAHREFYPRFKISRSGVSPDHFSANLSFLIEAPDPNNPPDNDDLRSPRIDVIHRLAYDDNYFYVNYSIPDLAREGLISPSLYIYSGNYADVNVPDILQFKGANLTLSGDWNIANNKKMVVAEGTTLKLTDDFNILNDGELCVNGTETNQCFLIPYTAEIVWGSILTNPSGKLVMRNCTIEYCSSIQVRGILDSKNVEINRNHQGLMIISSTNFKVDNTDISNCDEYALVMQNCTGFASQSYIKLSQFTYNKYGIFFYNSSPVLDSVFVTNNMHFGVMAMRNSNPVFNHSSITDTYYHDTNVERPEVVLYNDCYPSFGKNDIIFDDGYSIFTYDTDPEPYNCSNVYWGTCDTDLINQSFFPQPPSWDVTFLPILTESVINYSPVVTILSDYFDDAVDFEKRNDLETAKGMYCTIIENYPLSQQSKQAASRLVNIATTDYEIGLVKSFMNNTYNLYPSTKLANAAYLDSLYCERLMKDYDQAITGYESRLQYCNGALDSLLTQLDIIYTYLEADANETKSALVSCKINGVTLVSSEQAKELENQIMDEIVNQPLQGDITYHIPDTVISNSNYPNPFNPFTTISFSIPDKSVCNLTIYNIKGQVVRTLVNEQKSRGKYNILWNGTDQHGKPAASGVYFYRLNINGKPYTHKMMMVK